MPDLDGIVIVVGVAVFRWLRLIDGSKNEEKKPAREYQDDDAVYAKIIGRT